MGGSIFLAYNKVLFLGLFCLAFFSSDLFHAIRNQIKGNTDKCHLIVGTDEPIEILVGGSLIKSRTCEKLLDVKIYSKFNFDTYAKGLCKKASNILRALTRATPQKNPPKKTRFP